MGAFATIQAAEANEALAVLDTQLANAPSVGERVAAFEAAYRHVTDWRYQVSAGGQWIRPGAEREDFRSTIPGIAWYRLDPTVGGREPGSPAYRRATELVQAAVDRFEGSGDTLQNRVRLRDGRTVNGNTLKRRQFGGDEVTADTATNEDREVLRQAAFETLAELETRRAEAGPLDPHDPEQRQVFNDAAYFLVQGPEMRRGSDAIMRTFLVAAHTRVFDAAPVLPQGIDLDGMVRGQDAFNKVMNDELRVLPQPTHPASSQLLNEVSVGLPEETHGLRAGIERKAGELGR
jgi:hypothetical protein